MHETLKYQLKFKKKIQFLKVILKSLLIIIAAMHIITTFDTVWLLKIALHRYSALVNEIAAILPFIIYLKNWFDSILLEMIIKELINTRCYDNGWYPTAQECY